MKCRQSVAEAARQSFDPGGEPGLVENFLDGNAGRRLARRQRADVGSHADFGETGREARRFQPRAEIGRPAPRAEMPAARNAAAAHDGERLRDGGVRILRGEPGAEDGVVIVDRRAADGPAKLRAEPLLAAAGAAEREQEGFEIGLDEAAFAGPVRVHRFASIASQTSAAMSAPPKRLTSRMPVGEVTLISVR